MQHLTAKIDQVSVKREHSFPKTHTTRAFPRPALQIPRGKSRPGAGASGLCRHLATPLGAGRERRLEHRENRDLLSPRLSLRMTVLHLLRCCPASCSLRPQPGPAMPPARTDAGEAGDGAALPIPLPGPQRGEREFDWCCLRLVTAPAHPLSPRCLAACGSGTIPPHLL